MPSAGTTVRLTRSLVAVLALLSAVAVAGEGTEFARVTESKQQQPLALQLAINSYVPRNGDRKVRVDLVGAIHIGDRAYYAELNERFEDYDALLYELIAPKDTVISREDTDPKGIISNTQVTMKNLLSLSFQLDEIDYSAANFVHADLSPTELSQSMDERGESLYVYFWRLFYASMNQYAKDPLGLKDMKMLTAMLSSDSDNSFKIMLAYEMVDLDTHREILGDDAESAVIGARNQRAIDVLVETLESGEQRVGIFYGVAHMPDMEERLVEQLDLVYLDTTWVDAWRLDTSIDR